VTAARSEAHQLHELRREGATMALYVSVVLLAELAAIPSGELPKGWAMVALIWGTTVGLALAHWFAFTVASQAIGTGRLERQDLEVGLAGVTGALVVALVASLPEVLLPNRDAERVLLFIPASIIGLGGFLVARAGGRTSKRSILWALAFIVAGTAVAGIKLLLGGH
jgi:hypothetical protein